MHSLTQSHTHTLEQTCMLREQQAAVSPRSRHDQLACFSKYFASLEWKMIASPSRRLAVFPSCRLGDFAAASRLVMFCASFLIFQHTHCFFYYLVLFLLLLENVKTWMETWSGEWTWGSSSKWCALICEVRGKVEEEEENDNNNNADDDGALCVRKNNLVLPFLSSLLLCFIRCPSSIERSVLLESDSSSSSNSFLIESELLSIVELPSFFDFSSISSEKICAFIFNPIRPTDMESIYI